MPPPDQSSGSVRFSSAEGRWILAVTVLGSGVAFLEATVVNIALPHIAGDLDTSTAGLQWTVNGYLVTLASLILLGGALGDRRGHRRIFTIGATWFTLASVLCALAPTIEVLVAARVLQGVGGALLTPGSLAIINSTFHPDDRARAIGAWSGLSGVAAAVGPLLGGYLISALSWRAIFLINVPLGLFVVVMALRRVPETRPRTDVGRLDYPGAILVALGLAGTTFALIQATEGVTALTVAAAVIGVGCLAGFVVAERHSTHPMVPLSMFRSRQFTAANIVTFVVYTALGGVFFMLVTFLQVSLGYTPTAAGLRVLEEAPSPLQDRFRSEFSKLQEWEQTQMLATVFDGITRHNPEGLWFRRYAQAEGFKAAIEWRDSGRNIPEGAEARRQIAELEQRLAELKGR